MNHTPTYRGPGSSFDTFYHDQTPANAVRLAMEDHRSVNGGLGSGEFLVALRKAAAQADAHDELVAACKAALSLAWEVGCETEDGYHTLLDDSRGNLFRQLSAALAKVTP